LGGGPNFEGYALEMKCSYSISRVWSPHLQDSSGWEAYKELFEKDGGGYRNCAAGL
jgi:hypothetical protein